MDLICQLFYRLTSFGDPLDFIANTGTIVGWIIGVSWLLRTWIRHSRRKKFLKFAPSSEGRVAMSIGIGTSPEKAVTNFLKEKCPDVPLVMTYSKEGYFSGKELLKVFEEIKLKIFALKQRGDIREVLLFYGGPVTVMAAIGAILDNWVPVKLFSFNGKYAFHFTLNKELVHAVPPKSKRR